MKIRTIQMMMMSDMISDHEERDSKNAKSQNRSRSRSRQSNSISSLSLKSKKRKIEDISGSEFMLHSKV